MVKKSNGDFKINSFGNDSNIKKEQMNEFLGQLNHGLGKMMNKINGNLHRVMEDVNADNLMEKNSVEKTKLKKVLKDRPVVETLKQDGKIKVNLDGETLLEFDLPNVEDLKK
ncbi:hypothetical protein [Bacillus chungangensis]|uniref:DNA-directed RNA polymerase subunit H (RpoH/RPB5) n=1 Tax=Bacillus chungangensis TaxID=587633 RepID=A0ABT9WSL9_9BACI|nr:hypothetical protein [Bacillus chungangensis]MDQ0176133.1 DNA-directed RNA polymerase subunit H (RpoH/RPB5) [Bacillus chungangensis]